MYSFTNMKELIGFKIDTIEGCHPGSERIVFISEESQELEIRHTQDCCEHVVVEEVHGDIQDLIGGVILMFEVASHDCTDEVENYGVANWTFYKIRTNKGDLTIRWLGMSNGYYSVAVDLFLDGEWL